MSEGKRKPVIQAEMLVGISAVVIGLCALGVSLYETSLMREEQRAAVLPLLELGRSYFVDSERESARWRLSLHAENVGIGPAQIRDFVVTVDGKPQPSWGAAMSALLGDDGTVVRYGQSTINGRTIPPDRTITMFDLRDTEMTDKIVDQFDRLDFVACYCSVFDECWQTRYSTFGTVEPVDGCSRSADPFEE